jgi:TolB-like protein/tetratricopeptide (TPR) repeat protein
VANPWDANFDDLLIAKPFETEPPGEEKMKSGNFFGELKRRNVYKVAVAYAIVGWLVVQIATQVFPFLEIPNWVVRLVIVLVAIGFPIALVIAWAFELTPEGIKRTEDVDLSTGRVSKNRTWIYVAALGAMFSIGLFFVGRYSARNTAGAARTELPAKSIAVLPFDNLSRDPDNAYFAEGVQDEILTRLAKVADLKVISRTSTQRFKSSPDNLPQIARQLGVLHILEGSVQKSADQVRVNVQLINAMTDAHLWADTYDRKLTDIFAVESEIAKTIADTLRVKLSGSEKTAMSKTPTANPEAYELYLKGRFFWNKRTGADFYKAIEYFSQAIAKDPNYGLAYVGLADSYLLLGNYGAAAPRDSIPQAKAAVQKALELDATLGAAYATSAKISSEQDFDFQQAFADYERSIQLSPNYANAHHWFAGALTAHARFDRAIAEEKRAVELDPLSLINNTDLGWGHLYARHYDEAIAQFRKTIEMDSHFYLAHYYLGEGLQLKGQLAGAIAEYRTAAELNDDPLVLARLGQAYARTGQRDEAQKILARLTEEAKSRYVQRYSFAVVLIGLGDKEGAIDALEGGYRNREGNDIYTIRVDPLLDDLRGHPRFEALAEKILPAREFGATAK